jgi:hypothetical protein
VGQGLDILHESGATTKAALAHAWRLVYGNRFAAFDPVNHRARLTAHEAIGGGHDANRNSINAPLASLVYRNIN